MTQPCIFLNLECQKPNPFIKTTSTCLPASKTRNIIFNLRLRHNNMIGNCATKSCQRVLANIIKSQNPELYVCGLVSEYKTFEKIHL